MTHYRQRRKLIEDRVAEINKRLQLVSSQYVHPVSQGPDRWYIVPFRQFIDQGFVIRGNKFRLKIWEDISTHSDELAPVGFCYALKKIVDPDASGTIGTNLLPKDWEFRYDFSPRGEEHEMPGACSLDALNNRVADRLPPFHVHVCELGTVDDTLHYPIGTPEKPLELLFEIIRLVQDEFLP